MDMPDEVVRIVEAVLLFHSGSLWTPEKQERWRALTGRTEATSKALCDWLREVRARHDVQPPEV